MNYTPYEYRLNMNGIEYPVDIIDISKFETQNPNIAINVLALEKSNDINTLYPLYIENVKLYNHFYICRSIKKSSRNLY